MNRIQAEEQLYKLFGINHFYDEQWKAIDPILNGKRVLMIERTSFGKSLCYQFPASQFSGVTIIFSPLIALMRDQRDSLNAKGIVARCINSGETTEENNQTIEDAIDGKVKILYVTPERQNSDAWLQALDRMNVSMIVVDEAHTISIWGHDFRPAFQRIVNLVKVMSSKIPILATTATATKRVQEDIEEQLGGLITIRGNLMRDNLNLHVVITQSEDEKMAGIAQYISTSPGMGIIYVGTQNQTVIYSKWLQSLGVNAILYNGGLDSDTRKEIEQNIKKGKYDCVVSTNALGMGMDIPNIRFIIHTQIPTSPIHYYQEIGRAGRDGKKSDVILFYNEKKDDQGESIDLKLPRYFINRSRPSSEQYLNFIDEVKKRPLTEKGMMAATKMKRSQIRIIKAALIKQGIIKEVKIKKSKKYEYQIDAPEFSIKDLDASQQAKLKDLDSMLDYIYTSTSRMGFLCSYLGDTLDCKSGSCDNTNLEKLEISMTQEMIDKIKEFREGNALLY